MKNKHSKEFLKILMALPILLFCFILFSDKSLAAKKVEFKTGDILVTSKSETRYFTGHNGLVISGPKVKGKRPLRVLHSPGAGKKPTIVPEAEWRKTYKTGVIVRPKNDMTGINASAAARTYYEFGAGKNLPYKVLPFNVSGSTYCSKLVADAYKRAKKPFIGKTSMNSDYVTLNYMVPYDFKTPDFLIANGFKNLGQY